jgi:V/A-type H+-transporting ATPase subunit C
MLRELNRYSGCYAKVRVMRRSLLKEKDYEELVSKHAVTELAAYLKQNTGYAKALEQISPADIHRAKK